MRVFGLNRLLHIQNLNKTRYLMTTYGSKSHVVGQFYRRELHQHKKKHTKGLEIAKKHQERETLDNKHWHVQEGGELQTIYDKIEELGYKVDIPKQKNDKIKKLGFKVDVPEQKKRSRETERYIPEQKESSRELERLKQILKTLHPNQVSDESQTKERGHETSKIQRQGDRQKERAGKNTENEVIEKELNKDHMITEKKLMNSLRKEMYCVPVHIVETLECFKKNKNGNGKFIDVIFPLKLKQNWKITLSEYRDRCVKIYRLLFEFLLFTFWNLKYNYLFCYGTLNLGLENNNFLSKNTNGFILKCDKGDDSSSLNRSSTFQRTSNTAVEDLSDFSDIEDVEDTGEPWEPPVPLTRGDHGVFDLEDLVDLLKEEKAVDICVIDIPKEAGVADHMVIVSAMSARHMMAMFQTVNWVYKQKKSRNDPYLDIEGKHKNDWLALHMGNIILHMFMPETRTYYDLETLWTVGPEFDDKSPDIASMGLYSISQSDMEWLEELEKSSTPLKSSRPKS